MKGHFCLTKKQLPNVEWEMEIRFTSLEVIFDTINSN